MSSRPVIPRYLCWAQARDGIRQYKLLPARTATDAIAQAELLLRTQKERCPWLGSAVIQPLILVEVEPYEPDSTFPLPIGHEAWQ